MTSHRGTPGNDIVIGDAGRVLTAGDIILRAQPKSLEVGGADTLFGNTGSDVVIGGHDGDVMDGGANGDDILLGDNGIVVYADGSPVANDVLSTDFTDGGGNDQIKVADGLNIIIRRSRRRPTERRNPSRLHYGRLWRCHA